MSPALLALSLLQAAGDHHERIARPDLEFEYSWPAEAQRIPALRARLMAERNAEFARRSGDARRDFQRRRGEGPGAMPHSYMRHWEVAGNNNVLLSLIANEWGFSGGAHGTGSFASLLWDRRRNRAVPARTVIGRAALAGMTSRYCARLDAMRSERRGGERVVRDNDDPFTRCPALAREVIAPVDTNRDGRFDTLCVLLPPYAAGPYVEGPYVVALAFSRADVAAVLPARRAQFAADGSAARACDEEQ